MELTKHHRERLLKKLAEHESEKQRLIHQKQLENKKKEANESRSDEISEWIEIDSILADQMIFLIKQSLINNEFPAN